MYDLVRGVPWQEESGERRMRYESDGESSQQDLDAFSSPLQVPSPLPSFSLSLPPLLKFLYGTILFRRSAYVPPILVLIISPPIPSQICSSNCIQDGA